MRAWKKWASIGTISTTLYYLSYKAGLNEIRKNRKWGKSVKKRQSRYRIGWDRHIFFNRRELAKRKAWELMSKGKGMFE